MKETTQAAEEATARCPLPGREGAVDVGDSKTPLICAMRGGRTITKKL
jgi:hypothetical protein